MVDIVTIARVNHAFIRVKAEPSLIFELSDHFTFDVPGAKFTPSYRNRVWDGKIRLLNTMTGMIYAGLLKHVLEYCRKARYEVIFEDDFSVNNFTDSDAEEFYEWLGLPEQFKVRDYQHKTFVHGVKYERGLFLSPTASGKSFIIYLLCMFYQSLFESEPKKYNNKILILVPTTGLVHQMASDFLEYGIEPDSIHKIYGGQEKLFRKNIVVTTWQSVYNLPKSWFDQFDMVVGDEAHLCKAKSLVKIMTNLTNCRYRFGFTGTLDGTATNKLVIEGLFGPTMKVTTTAELIENEVLAPFDIDCLVVNYPKEVRKAVSKVDYQKEMDFLVRCRERNHFIKNLALGLKGNTLILFQYVEKHGKDLYELIRSSAPDREIYFLHGGIDGQYRNSIRAEIELEKDCITVASYGVFSTGSNVKNLDNLIFASPSKSKIRNLQSIGRVLRKSPTGNRAKLYDVADDLSYRSKPNHTLNHFMERVKTYNEEKFVYKIYPVNLEVESWQNYF